VIQNLSYLKMLHSFPIAEVKKRRKIIVKFNGQMIDILYNTICTRHFWWLL